MNFEIVESFSSLMREKGIDKDILAGIVEDIFGMMVRKKYGANAKFDVVFNVDKGDIEIYLQKEVVETVVDPVIQIDPATARKKSGEALDVGEEYVEVVDLQEFGRRLVTTAKQNLNQRIKEIEKELIYNEYSGTLDEIIVGEVYQIRKGDILIIHNKNELVLPKSEQIQKERYKKGDTIRAVIKEVRKNTGNPTVIVSRTDTKFLARLFEIEIPEIYDGIIEIKGIAREPGERAKVAVESHDDRIDAVGACVGMKGVRIHAIVRELNNENIDVINYSEDPVVYITRALSPAKLKKIDLDLEGKKATILVAEDQVSLAIGKGGQNVRLAGKLTGFDLQLEKEGPEYDIELVEFKDELGEEVYNKFIENGYDTAQQVIEEEITALVQKLDMEEEKLREIVEMIKKEFEEAEIEDEGEEKEQEEEPVVEETSVKKNTAKRKTDAEIPAEAEASSGKSRKGKAKAVAQEAAESEIENNSTLESTGAAEKNSETE
ncbi:MAG: transcription termination/antitermination protein NusA [Bacteroidota bacterium]|nr:transcription termination/antitermination protein NusA [Bacteroidota bacterium]